MTNMHPKEIKCVNTFNYGVIVIYNNWSSEQFSTHFGVFCVTTPSLLKHIGLNITEFLTEIPIFLKDCAFYGLSQDLSDKNNLLNMEIFSWEYTSICVVLD